MDIHGRTVPHHLERVSQDSSSFQPINLGGSFMQTTQPVTLASKDYASSCFQNGTLRFTLPPPFCDFFFCERGSLSLIHDRISLLWHILPIGNRLYHRMKIQTFRPHLRQFSSRRGFGISGSKWYGTESS
ncbi:hypothetical protein AVEN_261885-1 [Araneus ventricosus]|uniref:Uncharacterized protein n=1 Tax=Araneus ventricosus TaxID=182803 RepID=A0A4Y2KUF0_ARAVE|nr:hypothetical protein AVEN_261885-1 [Araneus ventricosus]